MTVIIEGHAVSPDFDLTPELDAAINRLAHRAKEEAAARNLLYETFAFKIERFARRCARRAMLRTCEFADVQQEAFLVFCEMTRRWKGMGSFAGYLFTWFPAMLEQAIARLERGHPSGALSLDELDPPESSGPALLLVEALAPLAERELLVLELHVTAGLRLKEIAALLGCHPRTVRRIVQRARQRLAVTESGSDDAAPARSRTGGLSAAGGAGTSV